MSLLSERIKLIKVGAATVAGQGAINSTAVDMKGYEGVLFFVSPGAITTAGAQSINAAQDVASGGSFADLLGTKSLLSMTMTGRCFGSRYINRPSATSD